MQTDRRVVFEVERGERASATGERGAQAGQARNQVVIQPQVLQPGTGKLRFRNGFFNALPKMS